MTYELWGAELPENFINMGTITKYTKKMTQKCVHLNKSGYMSEDAHINCQGKKRRLWRIHLKEDTFVFHSYKL